MVGFFKCRQINCYSREVDFAFSIAIVLRVPKMNANRCENAELVLSGFFYMRH